MSPLRHARLLFAEVKQSQWMALGAVAVIIATYWIFLALALSPHPEVSNAALPALEGMSVILPPLGAALWGYLCIGRVFEGGRDVLHVRDRHYVTKAGIRASVPLLLLLCVSSGTIAVLVPQYSTEIGLLALRVVSWSVLCVAMVAFTSYALSAAFIGFATSLTAIVIAYGIHLGWLVYNPSWLRPGSVTDSLNHALIIAAAGALLMSALFVAELRRVRF